MMQHYKYGGSTAARTIACPAWLGLSADMPKQLSSSYADVGTMLHDCMEKILLDTDVEYNELLGFSYSGEKVTQEHINEKIIPAHKAFAELCKEYHLTEYEAETTMQRSDTIGGTADFIAVGEDVVCVGDWKFGDGIAVSPDHSAQGLFYAMLARKEIPDLFEGRDRLVIAIIQPNHREGDTLKTWETEMAYLDCYEAEFMEAVKRAEEGNQKPSPGDHCKWCPAMSTCPAKTGLVIKAKRVTDIQQENIEYALDIAKDMEEWIKEVRRFAHEQLELGVKFNEWKLVQKRATNKWHDEPGVLDVIRKSKKLKINDCVDSKVKSPTQLKKVATAKGIDFERFEAYCSATSSGTTIARQSDKRPEYLPTALGVELSKILG